MDGAIGCIPLCSDDLRLPSPECPNPRRVKFRNKCCEEWICEEGSEENRFETAMAGEWWADVAGLGAVCWGIGVDPSCLWTGILSHIWFGTGGDCSLWALLCGYQALNSKPVRVRP